LCPNPDVKSDLFGALLHQGVAAGRIVRFRAQGTSMQPAICDGESIAIAPVDPDDVVPGTVLLCRHETRLIAHRVVGTTMRGSVREFELRGDAKGANDAPVRDEAIVGRVVGVWRNGRLVSVGVQAPRGDSVYHRIAMRVIRAVRSRLERAGFR